MKWLTTLWRRFVKYATEPTDRIFGLPHDPVRELEKRIEKLEARPRHE